MIEPLRISIRQYGGRAHQVGNGPNREGGRGSAAYGVSESGDCPHAAGVVHVQDGKPLTAWGKKLLEGK